MSQPRASLSRQMSRETESIAEDSAGESNAAEAVQKRSSGLFKKLVAPRSSASQRRQRKWVSTVEAPRLEDLDIPPSHSAAGAASGAVGLGRRNSSDNARAARPAGSDDDDNDDRAVDVGEQSQEVRIKKRSIVRQFLMDSFRPRHRSENSSTKRRQASAEDAAVEPPASPMEAAVGGRDAEKRPKSPVGGLVNRLMNLGGDRRLAADAPARQSAKGLPDPSEIPLDGAYAADTGGPSAWGRLLTAVESVAGDRENRRAERLRKSSCPPGSYISVQERHKDLFSSLVHGSRSGMSEPPQQQQHRSASSSSSASKLRHSSSTSGCSGSGSGAGGGGGGGGGGIQVRENDKYIIIGPHRDPSCADLDEIRETALPHPGRVFEVFSQRHRCYDLIPTSSKLLVFDNNLNVKKAFFALVYNGLRAAPVWDSAEQRFVGMLTISDFISILHHFYRSALVPMEELESHRISTWRAQLQDRLKPFLWIAPEASLLDAIRLLLHAKVHRLPVVEPQTGNALFILTHKRILKYIYLSMHQLPMPDWLDYSLERLKIGTYAGIHTVSESTPLVKVLSLFVQHRVSALPVVTADGCLADIYSKFDVINLAATKTYNNLDLSVKDALQYRRDRFEGVSSCRASDSLRCAIEKLVTAEVHRLVLVDDSQRVIGVVSLSDILSAIVLNYEALNELPTAAAETAMEMG